MRRGTFYATALVVAILDQATKLLVAASVPMGASLPVIQGVIHIEPTRNPGGAFGILQAYGGAIMLLTAAVVVIIVTAYRKGLDLPGTGWIGLAMALGGAVGNLIDRIRLGCVYDFINLQVWPVFNLADTAITIGILLLLYCVLFTGRSRPAER